MPGISQYFSQIVGDVAAAVDLVTGTSSGSTGISSRHPHGSLSRGSLPQGQTVHPYKAPNKTNFYVDCQEALEMERRHNDSVESGAHVSDLYPEDGEHDPGRYEHPPPFASFGILRDRGVKKAPLVKMPRWTNGLNGMKPGNVYPEYVLDLGSFCRFISSKWNGDRKMVDGPLNSGTCGAENRQLLVHQKISGSWYKCCLTKPSGDGLMSMFFSSAAPYEWDQAILDEASGSIDRPGGPTEGVNITRKGSNLAETVGGGGGSSVASSRPVLVCQPLNVLGAPKRVDSTLFAVMKKLKDAPLESAGQARALRNLETRISCLKTSTPFHVKRGMCLDPLQSVWGSQTKVFCNYPDGMCVQELGSTLPTCVRLGMPNELRPVDAEQHAVIRGKGAHRMRALLESMVPDFMENQEEKQNPTPCGPDSNEFLITDAARKWAQRGPGNAHVYDGVQKAVPNFAMMRKRTQQTLVGPLRIAPLRAALVGAAEGKHGFADSEELQAARDDEAAEKAAQAQASARAADEDGSDPEAAGAQAEAEAAEAGTRTAAKEDSPLQQVNFAEMRFLAEDYDVVYL